MAVLELDFTERELGEVDLTEAQKSQVIFRKYESPNPMLSDTHHNGAEWLIQLTADERIGLTEDDGCIIDFIGRRTGEVGILPSGEVLDAASVEVREETTGQNVPRYTQWEFRIGKITKTDGPQGRLELHRSLDEKRKEGETDMFNSIASAFATAVQALQAQGNVSPSPDQIQSQIIEQVGEKAKAKK